MVEEFGVPAIPGDLAVGPEEGIWFTGLNASGAGTIFRLSTSGDLTGEYVVPIGVEPDMPESSWPGGIAMGAEGDMWFSVGGSNKEGDGFIGRVTPAGHIVEFPVPPYAAEYGGVGGGSIARGADGAMWFTDVQYAPKLAATGLIGRIAPDGTVKEFAVPTGSQPNLPVVSYPIGIARGSDGNMWFTDEGRDAEGNFLVGRITPSGSITEFPIPQSFGAPHFIARGAGGDMWFTLGSQSIGRMTPTDELYEYHVPNIQPPTSRFSASLGPIVLGPDGNMWFTTTAGLLGRMTPMGSVVLFAEPAYSPGLYQSLAQGPEGDLWYPGSAGHVARLTTPLAPEGLLPPVVSGSTGVGSALSTSNGTWSHEPSLSYQWQLCDRTGAGCEDIAGQTRATITLAAGEVGHTLRAAVTASNIGGAAVETSLVSGVVDAPPPVSPAIQTVVSPSEAASILPAVTSSMTWKFGWALRFTVVESLAVHGLPQGGWVDISCRGSRCPFGHKRLTETVIVKRSKCRGRKCVVKKASRPGEVSLGSLFGTRHLTPGTRISVSILKEGWAGKSFTFAMRANAPPKVAID
jgi:streptogramin lyase